MDEEEQSLSDFAPRATVCSIIAGVGRNYRIMPDIFRDDHRLPDKTMNRYCFNSGIGMSRFSSVTYKTQADLDAIAEAAKAEEPKVIVEVKGTLHWTPDEALQYLEEKSKVKSKPEPDTSQAKPRRKEKTLDEIYYATMNKAERTLPEPTAVPEELVRERRWETLADRQEEIAAERDQTQKHRATINRRLRQKEAMDAGLEFSTPKARDAGIVYWNDMTITDIKLVRLVLGDVSGNRDMTEEEQTDYWHWKARE